MARRPKNYRHDTFGKPEIRAALADRRLTLTLPAHSETFIVWTVGASAPFAFYASRAEAERMAEASAAAKPGRTVCVYAAALATRYETGAPAVTRTEVTP